ncbi:MAG: DJ-1/PfpI family protein [Candidatus Parabeggiatoa sp.]|nr:DJ-1/PfpI family protein [Candidatus Parabeggiatoa sp.]
MIIEAYPEPIISTRLPRFINCSKTYSNKTKYTAAICAAPKILANACLLNKSATHYPSVLDKMSVPEQHFVEAPVIKKADK